MIYEIKCRLGLALFYCANKLRSVRSNAMFTDTEEESIVCIQDNNESIHV